MKLIRILSIVAAAHLAAVPVLAGEGCTKPGCAAREPCVASCRQLTCRPVVKTEKVSKSCFTVDCKDICIPAITFPWEKRQNSCSGCDGCVDGSCGGECFSPRCGKVISVRVLGKQKYEVEECVCEWKIEETCCDGGCKPGCGTMEVPGDPMLLPADPPSAPPAPVTSLRRPPLFNFLR